MEETGGGRVMSMTWTKDQQKVIDTRNTNLLVSAAAGSGKTAVLVERILSLITDAEHPVDVDRLLITTFTKAAAGEMRERISRALAERLKEDPGNEAAGSAGTPRADHDDSWILSLCDPKLFSYNWSES